MGSEAIDRRRQDAILQFASWIYGRLQEAERYVELRPADVIRLRRRLVREMYEAADRLMELAYGWPDAAKRRRFGKRSFRRG